MSSPNKKPLSFSTKLISIVSVLVIASLAVMGTFLYANLYSAYQRNAYETFEKQAEQIAATIDESFYTVDLLAMYQFANQQINSFAAQNQNDNTETNKLQDQYEQVLPNLSRTTAAKTINFIQSTYIFKNQYQFIRLPFSRKADQENADVYMQAWRDNKSGPFLVSPTPSKPYIYVVRNVYNLPTQSSPLTLIVNIFEQALCDNYASFFESEGNMAFLIDESGTIFSHRDKNMLGKTIQPEILKYADREDVCDVTIDSQPYLMVFKKVAWGKLTLAAAIPKDKAFVGIQTNLSNFIIILISTALVSVFLIIGILYFSTRFFKNLASSMELVAQGNFDVKMHHYRDRELQIMSCTFNDMTSKIKGLVNKVYQGQLLLNEAELKFLQSQINPHFLFNVLVSIKTKARKSNDETVCLMMDSLCDLLRAGIYDNKRMIMLGEELKYVEQYLYLQKMRFEDRLNYNIVISNADLKMCRVPRLSIEAIVENAIVHGIENKISPGHVTVVVSESGDDVVITVDDDGVGFNTKTLGMEKEDSNVPTDIHNQIGLKNTHRRFQLVFGPQYGLFVRSTPGEGTRVTIKIPKKAGEVDV